MKIYHEKFSKKPTRAYAQEGVYNAIKKFRETVHPEFKRKGLNPTLSELRKFMGKTRQSVDQLFNALKNKKLASKVDIIREKKIITTKKVKRKELKINKQNNA